MKKIYFGTLSDVRFYSKDTEASREQFQADSPTPLIINRTYN